MPSQATGRIATTVGLNIRAARLAAGLTQRQLAEKIGVDAMLISKWERGKHRPHDDSLVALANLLGHGIADFYSEQAAA